MTPETIGRNAYAIEMAEREGQVASESRAGCCLTVTALQKTAIKSHPVLLKVISLRVAEKPFQQLQKTAKNSAIVLGFPRSN